MAANLTGTRVVVHRPDPPPQLRARPAVAAAEQARALAGQAARSLHDEARRAELEALTIVAEQELASMESRHRAELTELWQSAEAEARGLLDAARADAAAIRATTATLLAQLRSESASHVGLAAIPTSPA